MARATLDSDALSAFCESLSFMLAAGIQTDEAVHLLAESKEATAFKSVCLDVYGQLIEGKGLAAAMEASGAFPVYAVDMVRIGEGSGRMEDVLRSLGVYYEEESRLVAKIRSSIGYPTALLCVMSLILAFTVGAILPVFQGVYQSVSGGITAGSFEVAAASEPIAWVALAITLVCTVCALACFVLVRTESGRNRLTKLLEHVPGGRDAMERLALSRFTSVLAVYVAAGFDMDQAMKGAVSTIEHDALRKKAEAAHASMIDPAQAKSLVQAIVDFELYDPIHSRMLQAGARVGGLDEVLDRLAATYFDDAVTRMDRLIDVLEPVLAAFMTVAVGITLIAVMLPLIGIMGSMG